jgi:predicted DNA-binding ribbon-helix-helix protein
MKRGKSDVVQSTLRLPRALWVRINHIAARRNLSMQQAVQEAVVEYCRKETEKGEKS